MIKKKLTIPLGPYSAAQRHPHILSQRGSCVANINAIIPKEG